ncbi:NUDIX domain-containing protein [Nonomuraea sp. H19]|uniref:NUDIX domain-containing protein n=1 Tax=Nonomuraea sp. H19 TaxID=3452206 RepID=UPI003F8957D2
MSDFWDTVNRVITGAAAYITDEHGRVLLVDPNYRDHWTFPGGMIDAGEHPAQACAREIAEELGLEVEVEVGALLTVAWTDGLPNIPYSLVTFTFDCGEIASDTPITLQAEELDDYGFFTVEEAEQRLASHSYQRLLATAAARDSGRLTYLPPAQNRLISQEG